MSAIPVTDGLPVTGYLRLEQILRHVPIGRSSFLALVAAGVIPRPYKLTARCVAWRVEDVRLWLSSFRQVSPDNIDANVAKAIAAKRALLSEGV
ncbi:AlpA family transcriptional regulator [Pseudomonas sp. R5(2019)]|uniref:helix-turn-helix transcriptional regulator n=1 Tax=Pseudomonas sp. R5(2019) TaxID=2697566 RepID=UPI001412C847|nr:AlpA family phage regulatory protein [Pseudomonas sp. R5(2019)]NBA93445.1 AlpA family phage regulatory protein [Pseudomonas sp. R5(2019)]